MTMPHEWVGAGVIRLDPPRARKAVKSKKVTILSRLTIDVLDVYCSKCRRSYADAALTDCQLGSQHIGGPRKQPDPISLEPDDEWPDPHDPTELNGHPFTLPGL